MVFRDPNQGAAAIVFLIIFTLLSTANLYALSTRRPRKRFIFLLLFCLIRVGGNVAAIGWAVVLYADFDWLIASLVLSAEGAV
jgi:cobalamin synthase